jgi:hypothetical protein
VSTEELTDGHIAGHIIIDSAPGLALADARTPPEQEKGWVTEYIAQYKDWLDALGPCPYRMELQWGRSGV